MELGVRGAEGDKGEREEERKEERKSEGRAS